MYKIVDTYIHKLFYQWGLLVFQLRYFFLVIPIVVTVLLSTGLRYKQQQTNVIPEDVFTPMNGPWRDEIRVMEEHWPLDEEHFYPGKSFTMRYWNDVIVRAKDGGNLLRTDYLHEILRINAHVMDELAVNASVRGESHRLTYRQLCLNWDWACYDNGHVGILLPNDVLLQDVDDDQLDIAEDVINRYINRTYPIGQHGEQRIYFGSLLGGVNVVNDSGHFDFVKDIRLTYNLKQNADMAYASHLWKEQLFGYLTDANVSETLEVRVCQNDTLSAGLIEVSHSAVSNFAVTFAVLTSFAALCSLVLMRRRGWRVDWLRSKPLLAFAGVFTAGLAIVSAFGLVLIAGMQYNTIVTVMPFLVISIGVDDMFIMTAAWHRSSASDPANVRLAFALSEAAVSITITSLTDVLSFAVGCLTFLPGVLMFCAYTAVGIAFTYVYQITFFSAVMAVAGELEFAGRHAVVPCLRTVDPKLTESAARRLLLSGSRTDASTPPRSPVSVLAHEVSVDDETLVSKFFRYYYGPFLLHPATKICCLLLFLVYMALAVWGCFNITEGLNPKRLILQDNQLARYYAMMDETFWQRGMQVQVAVSNAPDLSNQTESDNFLRVVEEFEAYRHCMGPNATMFFLREFQAEMAEREARTLRPLPTEKKAWYRELEVWLQYTGNKNLWLADIVSAIINDTYTVSAFRFQIGLIDFASPLSQQRALTAFRDIAARHPQYNMSSYQQYYPFIDQYLIIMPSLQRSVAIAMGCMVLVALLLIPSAVCALLIVAAILSINIGVLGLMSFWGVNLDSVSIIAIIMSIGFAVDNSAHISYAYVKAGGSARRRAIRAMETLGWPVFQGAASTVLGMLVLATVDAYLISTFFKTVFLVISLGALHSLAFLPIALTLLLPGDNHAELNPVTLARNGAPAASNGAAAHSHAEQTL